MTTNTLPKSSRPHSLFSFAALRPWGERALFLISRLLWALFILFVIAFVAFAGLEMARGAQPLDALVMGWQHLLQWLQGLLHGDLGLTSSASAGARPIPVSEVLPLILARSLVLLTAALLLAFLIGLPLGYVAARHRHSPLSSFTLLLSILGASLPSFFIAMLLQMAVIAWVRRTGGPAPLPVGGFGFDAHIILPALVLAMRPIAQLTRITFLSLDEVLDQDYIRTAWSKGLRKRNVWMRHISRNAAIPIITTLATSLRFALSSLPVVELYFGWRGIGFNLLRAIGFRDDNLAVALLLSLGILFILINWLIGFLYGRFDPRLRPQTTIHAGKDASLSGSFLDLLFSLRDAVFALPLLQRFRARQPESDRFHAAIKQKSDERGVYEVDETVRKQERRKAWRRGTLYNPSFIAGSFILLGLFFVLLAGPRLWPHNPYLTQGLTITGGEFKVPPFEPDEIHRWGTDALGRDILSLVLAGAKYTLSIAIAAMLARMLVGFLLGAIAGWSPDSRADRFILGLAEITAAFPALILAMLTITALGIRNGPWVFVVGLSVVGWGEIMQFVRGQVMSIRPQPYIESALAVGLRQPQIISRHVLPNLFAVLLSLAALEMGAVLLLLAELGFVGIFIGGGAFADLEGAMTELGSYHYSDVPEWGSLLASMRLYARGYPWTAIYPSLAFVVAILGFNLLGEGIRRLVNAVSVQFGSIFNRRTVMAFLVILLMINWISSRTGATSLYSQAARGFDGERAYQHLQHLAGQDTRGRRLNTAEIDEMAEYIAKQFQAAGLQAGGEEQTFFQTHGRSFAALAGVPRLEVIDAEHLSKSWRYQQDFAPMQVEGFSGGQAQGPLLALTFGDMVERYHVWPGATVSYHPAMENMDFSDEILLLLHPDDIKYLQWVPYKALLVVAPPEVDMRRYAIYAGSEPIVNLSGGPVREPVPTPHLWITEEVANALLADSGASVLSLRDIADGLGENAMAKLPTGYDVNIDVPIDDFPDNPTRHVIGHLPGIDAELDNQVIMIIAKYDGLGVGPDGTVYPGANDNAAAIAVMLEMLRAWQESNYRPDRTFLFIAYAGEGYETSQGPHAPFKPERFLKAKYGFSQLDIEAIVLLRGLGTGEAQVMEMGTGGNLRLLNLFEDAASKVGLKTQRSRDAVDLSAAVGTRAGMTEAPTAEVAPNITLGFRGWDKYQGLSEDSVERIDPAWMEKIGRALSTGLMVLGKEERY
ncbi:MAG TPA: ABC transporter permease subunit [Caldilineae bacterium]|nr:ABC transporter permease subunit [Caldilineae bacterium]